jgi:hypothetical protein
MTKQSVSPRDIPIQQNIQLQFICEIKPEKDERGEYREYEYSSHCVNEHELDLHPYGKGPFCRFSIPSLYYGLSGVYFIFENDDLRYIGQCSNLETRFNEGYGVIHRRNCLTGGQQTNCRINHLILEKKRIGSQISLYFLKTKSRNECENRLISFYNPPWNLSFKKSKSGKNFDNKLAESKKPDIIDVSIFGKYHNLQKYLKTIKKTEILLSYHEIENILGFSLPPSAYKHHAWWSNDQSHSHSQSWMKEGWRVKKVELGHTIKFSKGIIQI